MYLDLELEQNVLPTSNFGSCKNICLQITLLLASYLSLVCLNDFIRVLGFRGLILAPTRELALQTLKFTKELGRFVGLQAVVILGGEKIEDQFAAIHSNPDVIIATPGRFLHVILEMDLNLSSGWFSG